MLPRRAPGTIGAAWEGTMTQSTGVGEAWQKAFVAGDVDAIVDLYADDAVLYMPSFEILAQTRDEIRAGWTAILAGAEVDEVEVIERDERIDGDLAYAHQHGVVRGKIGGEAVEIPFRTTEVMRRGADGNWKYVVDHA
jgi:ketosteroid isomerase-like protein